MDMASIFPNAYSSVFIYDDEGMGQVQLFVMQSVMLHVWRGVRMRVSLSSPTAYSRPTQPDITAVSDAPRVAGCARACQPL